MKLLLPAMMMLFGGIASAQDIVVPLDTNTVTVDGVLNAAEWQNAATATINVNSTDNITVRYKYYQGTMYFVFTGKLESANALFPEVLIDAKNQGGSMWMNDQWWLHVSATDCEHNGAYGVYDNCQTVQTGWEGAPNFTAGAPMTDTVEMSVSFAKVGFDIATMDTMRIAFVVTNTANIFKLYPSAADRNIPATWATAVFSKTAAGVEEQIVEDIAFVYPNPVQNTLYIKSNEAGVKVLLCDVTGCVVQQQITSEKVHTIDMCTMPAGLYIVSIENAAGMHSYHKVVKQ